MQACVHCGNRLSPPSLKYCSNKCQADNAYHEYINLWKQGKANGARGIRTKNISGHIRRYIFQKYASRCTKCGWGQINNLSGNIPLEIDHIDGDSDNNAENNLRLLCPNCHSLTTSFRNLNKGSGRGWRREKYIRHT